jgi:hypothetical protein
MERGHEVRIIARDKEMLLNLLRIYGLPYISLSKPGKSLGAGETGLISFWEYLKVSPMSVACSASHRLHSLIPSMLPCLT